MRVTKYIPISQIDMDSYPMNPSTLSLIDYIREGNEVNAIEVLSLSNGRFRIKDGCHRVLAHKMLGLNRIKANYSTIKFKIK